MARKKLEEEVLFELQNISLVGIVNSSKEYLLVHYLNKELLFDFKRENDFEVYNAKKSASDCYCFYFYSNEKSRLMHVLLGTRNAESILHKELKAFDYLLFIHGRDCIEAAKSIVKNSAKIPGTIYIQHFDFSKLKKVDISLLDLKKPQNKEIKRLAAISDYLEKSFLSEMEANYWELEEDMDIVDE